jgi:hypothetical protein
MYSQIDDLSPDLAFAGSVTKRLLVAFEAQRHGDLGSAVDQQPNCGAGRSASVSGGSAAPFRIGQFGARPTWFCNALVMARALYSIGFALIRVVSAGIQVPALIPIDDSAAQENPGRLALIFSVRQKITPSASLWISLGERGSALMAMLAETAHEFVEAGIQTGR